MNEKQVLVVDDEASILMLFEAALGREGYKVVAAKSSEEALEILKEQPIFVMFLDLNLPGMNGVSLCREILKITPIAIPFAITGYASHFELAECKAAGFEDYFKKPVALKTIFKAVESAFEKLERWKKN